MRDRKILKTRKSRFGFSAVLGLSASIAGNGAAHALTAAEVLSKMSAEERHAYKAGIVDGLAQARWIKDKPNETGMKCAYDWFYKSGDKNTRRLDSFMRRHQDQQLSGLIYVLIKKDCGW